MRGAAALSLVLIGAAGCGGDASGSASRGEMAGCANAWNSQRAATTGAHAYSDHGAREALVTTVDAQGGESCAVIFSVPADDEEYGTVGEVATLGGWVPMQTQTGDAAALQRRGADEANATVAADGTVKLR